jgi:hypothetical protein
MTNVVIVNRRGVQMRQSNGRYAQRIVPPAVAASIGPSTQPKGTNKIVRRTQGPNAVVPVDPVERRVGPGVYNAQPPTNDGNRGTSYRVVK